MSEISDTKPLFSGLVGGIALTLVGHPFDTYKVRQQTSSPSSSSSSSTTPLRALNIRTLYAGLSAPLATTPILQAASYTIYQGVKARLLSNKNHKTQTKKNTIIAIAAFAASAPAPLIITPIERVKIIMQTQGNTPANNGKTQIIHTSPLQAAKHIIKTQGFRQMFKGATPTLLRDVPGTIAFFLTYENIQAYHHSRTVVETPFATSMWALFAGGTAGIMNWVVALPADVIKSRMQAGMGDSFISVSRQVVQQGGIAALYKGIGPVLIRAFPANAAMFFGIEWGRKGLDLLY